MVLPRVQVAEEEFDTRAGCLLVQCSSHTESGPGSHRKDSWAPGPVPEDVSMTL